ncbi:MAG: hypothetical protein IT369_19010, partial [Candidatus Latescibacteria bacterium]|nr:hypothetical protein [Candidatus Latescibacterota bacterium]
MKPRMFCAAMVSLLACQVSALQLGAGGYGLALGNEPVARGLRLNLRDHQVQRVDGLNLT